VQLKVLEMIENDIATNRLISEEELDKLDERNVQE
jgi:hypothetical protein